MVKSVKAWIAGIHRPQMSKRRNRGHGRILGDSALMPKEREKTSGVGLSWSNAGIEPQLKTALSSKVETFEFNRGRPFVDRDEKMRVKRNLFGDEEKGGKLLVNRNRKLRAQLKAKKKLFRSSRRSSEHECHPVEVTDRVSSWVASHHSQPCYRSCHFPVNPPLSSFLLEDIKPRSSAKMSCKQFLGLEIAQGVSDDQNMFHNSPLSFLPPSSSSAVSPADWRGSITITRDLINMESNCPSPRRLKYRSSPLEHQIAVCSHDLSLPFNSSFQDNTLFCSSYSNIEDEYTNNACIPSSLNISTSCFNWVQKNNRWDDSPVRNMKARIMW